MMSKKRRDYLLMIGFGFVCLLFAMIIHQPIRRAEARLERVSKWPAHPATILRSEIIYHRHLGRRGGSRYLHPWIVYRYEVGGIVRTNETRPPISNFIGIQKHAARLVQRFRPGAERRVRVNPSNPYDTELIGAERGELEKKSKWVTYMLVGIGCFLIVGGGFEFLRAE